MHKKMFDFLTPLVEMQAFLSHPSRNLFILNYEFKFKKSCFIITLGRAVKFIREQISITNNKRSFNFMLAKSFPKSMRLKKFLI